MAKDGTNRGGRRVRAGDKPDALADKIARGKAAQVMDLPIVDLDGTDEFGPIYRCECLLHEESSRMVYGAFDEVIMRKAYQELIHSPLGQSNLLDSAVEICAALDRLLVEKIWPAKAKHQRKLQEKEVERPAQRMVEGSHADETG